MYSHTSKEQNTIIPGYRGRYYPIIIFVILVVYLKILYPIYVITAIVISVLFVNKYLLHLCSRTAIHLHGKCIKIDVNFVATKNFTQ